MNQGIVTRLDYRMNIRRATGQDRDEMLDIWERSVRATHDFLSTERINELIPLVRKYLASGDSEFWVIVDGASVCGFMGMHADKIESLFLAPEKMRQGLGTQLVKFATTLHDPLFVDVNEENVASASFYEAFGFERIGRSELDDQGNPHPLLHLKFAVGA